MLHNTLRDLPIELLEQVIGRLDPYSVRSLLEGVPWLRAFTILVMGKVERNPTFFTTRDIPKITLDEVDDKDTRFIRLFEIKLSDIGDNWPVLFGDSGTSPIDKPCAFLSIDGEMPDFLALRLEKDKAGHTRKPLMSRTVFDSGYPVAEQHFVDDLVALPGPTSLSTSFSTLEKLVLTGIRDIENMDFPMLKELHVHFYAPLDDLIPELGNITAPLLETFSVVYSGELPAFLGLGKLGSERRKRGSGTLKLINTRGLDFMSDCLVDYTTDEFTYDDMELDFIKNFSDVTFVGVPPAIVYSCDLLGATSLTWVDTVKYTMREEDWHGCLWAKAQDELFLAQGCTVTIITSVPGRILPFFFSTRRKVVNILTTASGTRNLSGVLCLQEKGPPDRPILVSVPFEEVRVSCLLKDSDVGGDGHPIVSRRCLQETGKSTALNTLCLEGCYFGKKNSAMEIYPIRGRWFHKTGDNVEEPSVKHLYLGFVKPLDNDETVGSSGLFWKRWNTDLAFDRVTVDQIRNDKTVPWRTLNLNVDELCFDIDVTERNLQGLSIRSVELLNGFEALEVNLHDLGRDDEFDHYQQHQAEQVPNEYI